MSSTQRTRRAVGRAKRRQDMDGKSTTRGDGVRATASANETALADELADLQQLQDISSQWIHEGNLDALYKRIAEAASALMRSEMSSMQMLYPERDALRLLAWKGFDPVAAAHWEWVRHDTPTTCGVALYTGKRVIVADVETCDFLAGTEELEYYHLTGIKAVQSTPLLSRSGDLVGMLSTHWRTHHQPSERELRLLDVLARQAADLIEHARVEAALRDKETRLRLALEASSSGSFVWYPGEDRGEPDEQMLRLFGQPPESTLNLAEALATMIHVDDGARYGEAVARATDPAGTGELREDIRVVLPDGTERWLAIAAQVFFASEGGESRHAVRMAGTATDITERKRLEQHTREALDTLLAMAETIVVVPEPAPVPMAEPGDAPGPAGAAPNVAGTRDPGAGQGALSVSAAARATIQQLMALAQQVLHGQYTACALADFAADALTPLAVEGLTPEIKVRWWADIRDKPMSAYLPLPMWEQLRAEQALDLDFSGRSPILGQDYFGVRRVLVVGQRLTDGRLVLFGAEVRDQPAVAQRDRDLAQAATRLVALVLEREQLDRARTEAEAETLAAEQANERMRTFVGIAGHELRTPLTSLQMNVQMAGRAVRASLTSDSPEGAMPKLTRAQGLLERSDRELIRLNRLIQDMLDMTRMASGKLDLRLAPDDLGDLVRDAVETQRLVWPSRAIRLNLPEAPLTMSMDADRVSQVITNLLTNALKYSAQDADVAIVITVAGDAARVAVRDHGPGLAPDAQVRLWEPFQQVEGINQRGGSGAGLGLGLYISKTIVERHGGQIGVTSTPGAGSTFWFTLPMPDGSPGGPLGHADA